jgi:hypothetical protein
MRKLPLMESDSQSSNGPLVLKAGATYFAVVFGAGCLLGPLRVIWLVPRFGERIAELMEQPLMLLVIIFTARWVVGRFAVPPKLGVRLSVGLLALSLLLSVEFTVVLKLRGISMAEYVQGRDPIAGSVYLLMLVVLAVMPLLIRKR